ncbi:MAG: alpha/beta fold hydrolase [Candidatus Paceibacterota bacterium]
MKTAIILHGMPSKEGYFDPEREAQSNSHWLPWVQRQLILKNVLAQAIELPTPYEPVYEDWKRTFEQFHIDEDTILIGHSCGGGFLIRWLSENNTKVGRVVLVAPWLDPDGEVDNDFFDFQIDPELVGKTDGIHIFISEDDDADSLDSLKIIEKKIKNVSVTRFKDRGHFTYGDMGTEEFLELIDVIFE